MYDSSIPSSTCVVLMIFPAIPNSTSALMTILSAEYSLLDFGAAAALKKSDFLKFEFRFAC